MTPTANSDPGEYASSVLSGMLNGPGGRLRAPSGGLLASSPVSPFSLRLHFVTRSKESTPSDTINACLHTEAAVAAPLHRQPE